MTKRINSVIDRLCRDFLRQSDGKYVIHDMHRHVCEGVSDADVLAEKESLISARVRAFDKTVNTALPKSKDPRQADMELVTNDYLRQSVVSTDSKGGRLTRANMTRQDMLHCNMVKNDKADDLRDAANRELLENVEGLAELQAEQPGIVLIDALAILEKRKGIGD